MKCFKKILVAMDTRMTFHPVLETAAKIARAEESAVTMVDVVPDLSWAARLTMSDHEHLHDLMRQEKAEKLEFLAAPIRDSGIDVETKLLEGKTSVEIVRQVLREQHDLVLAIAKGPNSQERGFFGHTAKRLLRNCPSALWLVAPESTPEIKHALACVDTSNDNPLDAELNEKIYELATSLSQHNDSQFSLVHAWFLQDGPSGSKVQPEAVREYAKQEKEYHVRQVDEFLTQRGSRFSDDGVHVVNGTPAEVIPRFAKENAVDLVVMGTVARMGLTGVLMGNTAEKILAELECSVLAVKPDSFKSPIRLR